MKKLIMALALLASIGSANAYTWWDNGVYMGNVCRSGYYYYVYPLSMGQPVGTGCPIRNNATNIIGWGYVSDE